MAASLDLNRFNAIMAEYAANFENAPKSTAQVAQFCKSKKYSFKYGALNPFFSIWKKQSTPKSPQTSGATTTDPDAIDWDTLWSEYETKYENAPKKPLHLFNFAKDDKGLSIKYKTVRVAFARIAAQRVSIEGAPSALALETNAQSDSAQPDKSMMLVFPKKRTSDDVEKAKAQFLELLQQFRSSIMHDPASPLQLFHFINESSSYKARYGDVKRCYEYAVRHKWFRRMKRTKKGGKSKRSKTRSKSSCSVQIATSGVLEVDGDEGTENGDDEGVHFVLEIDVEAEQRERVNEEQKEEVVPLGVMDDETFTVLLAGYSAKYENSPRTASQIMNFAKEEGQVYRYKACRVAFQRWKNIWSS